MQHWELLIWLDLLRIHEQVKNLFFFAIKSEVSEVGVLDFYLFIYLLLSVTSTSRGLSKPCNFFTRFPSFAMCITVFICLSC